MNRAHRVINNTIISLLGQAVSWGSTLLLTIAYGRFLGADKFGELYLATTFISLIGVPIEAGYGNQVIRDVAREPSKALEYLSNIFLIKLGIWPILYSIALLASWLLGYNGEVRILVGISGFSLLTGAIGGTFRSLYYALERPFLPVLSTVLEKGLTAIFGILLLKFGAGVQIMAGVLVVASLVSTLWLAIWFFRLVGTKFTSNIVLIRQILRTNIPFFISGALLVSYDRIDTVLLSLMTNNTIVGWYGAGIRLFDALNFLPNILIWTIMYPIFSRLSATSDEDLKVAFEKSINFLLFCSVPIAVLLIVAAPNIIGFLYGRSEFFIHSVPTLQALAPGVIFLYINFPITTILLSKRQDKKIPIMAAIGLIFTLVLNIILIPLYQQIGAAIATASTELLLCCVGLMFIPRNMLPVGSMWVGFKALAASMIMAVVILPLHAWNIFAIIPVAALTYLVAATLFRTIPLEDYQVVYSAIRRKSANLRPGTEELSKNSNVVSVTEKPSSNSEGIAG